MFFLIIWLKVAVHFVKPKTLGNVLGEVCKTEAYAAQMSLFKLAFEHASRVNTSIITRLGLFPL